VAVSASIAAVASVGMSVYQSNQQRKAAEAEAARQREAIAALEAKPQPVLAPQTDQEAARRSSIKSQLLRRGRQSTILSDTPSDTLGA
jgi:uncharacterized membrane protein YebE (DUF533 family)